MLERCCQARAAKEKSPANKRLRGFLWSWKRDLNTRPADYESAALPTELFQRNGYHCNGKRAVRQEQTVNPTENPPGKSWAVGAGGGGCAGWGHTGISCSGNRAKRPRASGTGSCAGQRHGGHARSIHRPARRFGRGRDAYETRRDLLSEFLSIILF